MPVSPENWDAVAARISRKYEDALRRGNERVRVEHISTGSPELDVAMRKGVPQGRFTRFYGGFGCLAPETKVLTDSYNWIELGTLDTGDGLVGFDEFPVHNFVTGRGVQRKLRYSEISENPFVVLPSYQIRTDRDTDVIASDNHLWLVSKHYPVQETIWVTSEELKVGDRILWFGEVWPELSQSEREMAAYLGGLFDGEGSIDGNRVTFYQNSGAVLDRGLDYMQKLGFRLVSAKPKDNGGKCINARFCGTAYNLLRFLSYIPSVRLSSKAIWEGREILPKGPHVERGGGYATVTEKKFVGQQELCAVGTTTQTLVADGLYTHNSTKTMTALSCIAEAQRRGLKCVLFNIEKRYEDEFAKALGVDTKALHVVTQTSIEAIGDIWESLLGVAHFFVLDSCSVAVSEDELNCDIRDWRPGISSRAWGKVFRRINERWDDVDNTAILIDQVRVDFKTGGENPAGGRIFDHQSAMSVLFKAGKWLYRDEDGILTESATHGRGADGQTVPAGRQIKIRIEKSSVCRPFRTATLHYDLDTLEYDRVWELMRAARHYGIVTGERGNYEYIDDTGEVTKIRGEKKLRDFIGSSKELQKYIHETALEAADQQELQFDHMR